MPNLNIDGLPAATTPYAAADRIEILQAGINRNGPVTNLDAAIVVAGIDAPAAVRAHADYQATGTADQTIIQQALDALPAGGGTLRLAGTLTIAGTVNLDLPNLNLIFDGGANLKWTSVTGQTPLLRVAASKVDIVNPKIQGSGNKGNGTGILGVQGSAVLAAAVDLTAVPGTVTVDSTAGFPRTGYFQDTAGVNAVNYTGKTATTFTGCTARSGTATLASGSTVVGTGVHDVAVYSAELLSLDTGVEWGIAAGDSSGDNALIGGSVHDCKTGIKNKGFTNRASLTRIYSCDIGIDCTNDRVSQKFEGYGLTISQWGAQAIRVRGGHGSVFESCWLEHTGGGTATEAILIGGHTTVGDATNREAIGVRFVGTTKLTLATEQDAFRLVNCRDLTVDNLMISTNGSPPVRSVVRTEATVTGSANRIDSIAFVPGSGGLNTFGTTLTPTALSTVIAAPFAVATITFAASHNLVVGQQISVTGTTPAAYNGNYVVASVPSTTTVTVNIASTTDPGAATVLGTVGYYPMVESNVGGTGSEVVIRKHPDVFGSPANTTIGGSGEPNQAATYTIFRSDQGTKTTYYAKAKNGHIAAHAADLTNQSGLKKVLESLAANDVHFHFGPGRFHFLDAPLGTEAWAGVQDHAGYVRFTGLMFTGDGWTKTIVSNRTNQTLTSNPLSNDDTEPFSFTNCRKVTFRDLQVESCGQYKSTTDAIDCDQGTDVLIERVRIIRSRARAIVIDGGDAGKWAGRNTIRGCHFLGRPERPQLDLLTGGTLTASTTYTYVVAWVDQDLGGAGVSGETKPSDPAVLATTATAKTIRLYIPAGSYNTTARRLYRYDGTTWKLLGDVAGNATTTFDDNGIAGTTATMPVSNQSTIPDGAIEMLACSDNTITGNFIDGVGDLVVGLNQQAIRLVRKSSTNTTSDRNKVTDNTIRQSGSHGILVLGGNSNRVAGNVVSNAGTVATKAQAIRIDGATGTTTNRNIVESNVTYDDQTAASWSGGVSTNNSVTITATATPTNNRVFDNDLTGFVTSAVSDLGTTSTVRDNQS